LTKGRFSRSKSRREQTDRAASSNSRRSMKPVLHGSAGVNLNGGGCSLPRTHLSQHFPANREFNREIVCSMSVFMASVRRQTA
jgi:hypothetical protein